MRTETPKSEVVNSKIVNSYTLPSPVNLKMMGPGNPTLQISGLSLEIDHKPINTILELGLELDTGNDHPSIPRTRSTDLSPSVSKLQPADQQQQTKPKTKLIRLTRLLAAYIQVRDRLSLPERMERDWKSGELREELRSTVELLFSGAYIGWPFFQYATYSSKAYTALTKVLPVSVWGLYFYILSLGVTVAYLSGHRGFRRLMCHLSSFMWGVVMTLMYIEQVPGFIIPLGTVALIGELMRSSRLKERRKDSKRI